MSEKKPKKQKAEPVVSNTINVVLYCDGSAIKGNPGSAGYGLHAYFYDTSHVNINAFRKAKRTTKTGYGADTEAESNRVVPFLVMDGTGVLNPGGIATNNAAELTACIRGLYHIRTNISLLKKPIGELIVRSDSEYILDKIKAINNTSKERRKHVLLKPNNMGKQRPNMTLTIDLLREIEAIEDLNIKLKGIHVKAHNGEYGNERVDTLAKLGSSIADQLRSRAKRLWPIKETEKVIFSEIKPNEKNEPESTDSVGINGISFYASPLINGTNIVYSNDITSYVPRRFSAKEETYHVYCVSSEADEYREERKAPPLTGTADEEGENSAEEVEAEKDLYGSSEDKLDPNYPKVAGRLAHYKARTTRSIVLLKEPCQILEELMGVYENHQELRDFILNDIILFKIAAIFKDNFRLCYHVSGLDAVSMQDNCLDHSVYPLSRASLMFDKEYLALHVRPQKVSLYILENLCEIQRSVNDFFNNPSVFAGIEDITHLYYQSDSKGQTQLKPEIKVGFRRLELVHKTSDGLKNPVDLKFALVCGIHIPERNSLKRLEELHPKIYVVSILDAFAENCFCAYRYFVVIETDEGYGFYHAEMSNIVVKRLKK